MRVSKKNIQSYIQSIREVGGTDFELYLFGSRVNDHSRGGDIDLLIISDQKTILILKEKKALLLAKMKMKTDDERIDLTLVARESQESNEFYQSLLQSKANLVRLDTLANH